MQNFVNFIREQGVVGLTVGFLLGGAVSKLVTALVTDIVNPLLGLVLGSVRGLAQASFTVGGAVVLWGDFLNTIIDFLIVTLVVYIGIKLIGIHKLIRKRNKHEHYHS